MSLITYRTILAFFSEGKAITISINKYDEQYFDIVALMIIWIVFLISLIFFIKVLKREKRPVYIKGGAFFDLNSNNKVNNKKSTFIGFFSKPYSNIRQKFRYEK